MTRRGQQWSVRPAQRALSSRPKRERYTSDELLHNFELGYECGQGDERARGEHRGDWLRRLAEACEEGPDSVTALAREVGVMPDDGLGPLVDEQLVSEIEQYLRDEA